jgi:hypothetical protein
VRIAKTAPFVGNTRSVVIMVMKWLSCRRGLVRRAGVEIRIPTNRCVVVGYGSLADIDARLADVRFTPESGHCESRTRSLAEKGEGRLAIRI